MDQRNPNYLYAALGLSGQAGCLAVAFAIGALLLGLWLDQLLNTRHIFAIVCVVGSVPINLIITLRVTQRLIARFIPPDKSVTKTSSQKQPDLSEDDGQ
jgi:hypothetical protein